MSFLLMLPRRWIAGKIGDIGYPDRVRWRSRSSWRGSCRKPSAASGQRYRRVASDDGYRGVSASNSFREVVPDLRRLAIMANLPTVPMLCWSLNEAQEAAGTLGIDVLPLEIRRGEHIAPAFEGFKGQADALYVSLDPLMNTHRIRINTLALGARLPTLLPFRGFVEAGGLMSYGPNQPDVWRRAAIYVDKILHGAKPGDIPVEQPTKFDLVINLTTAKALGLTVPARECCFARADEVIE